MAKDNKWDPRYIRDAVKVLENHTVEMTSKQKIKLIKINDRLEKGKELRRGQKKLVKDLADEYEVDETLAKRARSEAYKRFRQTANKVRRNQYQTNVLVKEINTGLSKYNGIIDNDNRVNWNVANKLMNMSIEEIDKNRMEMEGYNRQINSHNRRAQHIGMNTIFRIYESWRNQHISSEDALEQLEIWWRNVKGAIPKGQMNDFEEMYNYYKEDIKSGR